MSNDPTTRLSKNERRTQAREQARLAREAEKKREKRRRLYIQGGVVIGVIAILAIVGLVLAQSLKPAGPGPKNMVSGAAVFTKDLKVVPSKALAEPSDARVAPETNRDELPLDVTVYVDYMCPACGAFEAQNGVMLENYVGSGDANLAVYPINFLDGQSLGTKYSTRAANAFGCVVEQQPDVAFELHKRLLSPEVQPAEATPGLDDKELLKQAEAAGAEATSELKSCIQDRPFSAFFSENYTKAGEGISGLAEGQRLLMPQSATELQPEDKPQRLVSTPLVLVNGQQWNEARDGSLETFMLKIKGEIEQASAAEVATD
ncbi:DsbA family protein [Leucobacter komagatae]|uniref:DSBA oxidoreductase n=1 Tax=Leucobacter komagatae TaxID=55969 RepID=A0A0D0HW93_9MICO|nr:thioredoxin domain-containing protein [Leucobacter komagatae]KIP51891.1 DSBA oxidoreductase [Leucobacter komagatae]